MRVPGLPDETHTVGDILPPPAPIPGPETAPPVEHVAPSSHDRSRWLWHVPRRWRALVRADEIWLTVLAAGVGALAGLCVVAMTRSTLWMHRLLFALHTEGRLSGLVSLPPWRAVMGPVVGGLALGMLMLCIAPWMKRRPVDPIEANALHGGRMSVRDSLIVAAETALSNGGGASIGLEAGFSQIAAAFGSWAGRLFRVRRQDMRILVGCGAGAAIGAAFDAPVAGAFYAFELVIGAYALVNLAPVAVASLCAVTVTRLCGNVAPAVVIPEHDRLTVSSDIQIIVIAVFAALVAIAIMKSVAATEAMFARLPVPRWLHPALGGLMVGAMAILSPSVLSAGHAAMRVAFDGQLTLATAGALLLLKALASSISIGSGFRGGLFFASLYLGVLAGSLAGQTLDVLGYHGLSPAACALMGMSAMSVAVVGSPMTMVCLALETTGDISASGGVLLASVLSLLTVRRLFGYSFATWRFHLRGESIRSAVDIGWMRSLNVRRMMREDLRTLPVDTTLQRARTLYPLGSAQRLAVIDGAGRYVGLVSVADLHMGHRDANATIGALAQHARDMLTPTMNVREAVEVLERAEADALVVVEDRESRQIVGILTEQHALRRYAEELDRTRRDLAGETRDRVHE